MHTLVLLAIVSGWISCSVDGAVTITYSGSNLEGSITYTLKCHISSFTSQAFWSKDGTILSTCLTSGCLTLSDPPYTFRHDASAIYVDFSTLAANENGKQWTCENTGEPAVNFVVQVIDSVGNYLCDGCWKAYLLMITCSVTLPIVKILIILRLWKDIYYKRKQSKRDKTDSDESTEDEGDSTSPPSVGGCPLWLRLLIICVFVDLIVAVLGGSITWWKRSTDGFCVEERVIIIIVVVSFVVFTIVEIALIWFLMIKRTGDEKGSRSKKTVNAMAAAETGAMSASNGDPKTSKNQNGPNWQPPNNKDPNDASQ